MARTKASVGAKVSSGKSSKARCSVAPLASTSSSSGSGDKASRSHSGGNPVCPRETPKWQKPITKFFICKDSPGERDESPDEDEQTAGSSNPRPKRSVIYSDDEDEGTNGGSGTPNGIVIQEADKPTNKVLDETLELDPLNGDDSHKIDEYYNKNAKGKGVGKKSKGKENLDVNVEKRNSIKRDLDEVILDEDSPHASKKVKVN